ncbi:MAG: hypothetical protein LBO07_07115 [Coriobacteriales bacterium]|nr:hypothetical protein [Coriobacteriales bacterium]
MKPQGGSKSKSQLGNRLLSCLLALVLTLGIAPSASAAGVGSETEGPEDGQQAQEPFAEEQALLDELSATAAEPGQGNVEQSNETWRFGEKDYKVIHNDYLACYVSLDDASFTVLPTATPFNPDKPASHARLTIDGEPSAFGEIRGTIEAGDGTIFIPPVVEKDMVVAHYAIGDYVVSQYLAITEEAGHENGYALKIGYGAEYFGAQPSTISGEILLDTLLGTDDNLALYAEDGTALTADTELAPAPDSLSVPQDASGAKAFLVLREENGTAPVTVEFGDLAWLAGDTAQSGMPVTDSAVKLRFEPVMVDGVYGENEASTQNDIAIFNTNYGFYGLAPAKLSLEAAPAPDPAPAPAPAPAPTAPATAPTPTPTPNLNALATGQGAHRVYHEAAEPNRITMLTQLTEDESGETWVNIGDEIAFSANLVNDGRVASRLELSYGKDVDGEQEQTVVNLTPDESGIYRFTVPADIYVSTDEPDDPSNNGQVGIGIFTETAPGAMRILTENRSFVGDSVQAYTVQEAIRVSSGGVDVGHSRAAIAGDTVSLVLERTRPDYMPVLEKFSMMNYDTNTETPLSPTSAGSDTYTWVVPAYTGNVGLHIEFGSTDRSPYVINKKIVQGASPVSGLDIALEAKGAADAAFVPLAPDAGLLRAKGGDVVKVPAAPIANAAWFAAQSIVALTAYNLSTGAQIATQDLKQDASDFAFTMPAANVELVLNLTAKPRVTTLIQYPADGDPDSGASLALSPTNPSAGDTVTVNINLFGSGYKLNDSIPLKVYKSADGSQNEIAAPLTYKQSYTFTMPNEAVTIELPLEKVPAPPALQAIATMPFVGEGQTIFDINYWVSKSGSAAIDAANEQFKAGTALDEAGKTMKAAVGSPIMFYASKPSGGMGLEAWELRRVSVIVGEGEDAVEHVFGEDDFISANGDAYTFTMPDAPVTIAAEGHKASTTGQIVTETRVLVGGEEYPYTEQSGAGNLQAYRLNGGSLEKADGLLVGEQAFIAAYPMLGGALKSLTVEQEGYAPLDIKGSGSWNEQLNTDVYSFTAMRGSVFRVTALYEVSNTATVLIMGYENDTGLEFIGERSRTLSFAQIYDPNATERGLNVASTIIELKTIDERIGDYVYTLSKGANPGYGADDILLDLLEYQDGYARYRLTVSATQAQVPIELYVEKSDYTARPVITGMSVNHTNKDRFNNLVLTGKNLRNFTQTLPYDYSPNIFLRQIGPTGAPALYQVPRTALQPNAAGTEATLALRWADLALVEPSTAPAKPTFTTDCDYDVQIEWYWGRELGPMTLSDVARTSWTLNDASFDFKPNAEYCYAAVGLLHSFQFSYGIVAGETMDAVLKNSAFSETYLTLECKGGFSITTTNGATQLTLKDPKSPVLINGMLTLEPSGAAGTPFMLMQSRDPGGLYNVVLSTNQRLVAKGTTLYSPVGSMGTLRMDFESGTYYSATEETPETPQVKGRFLPTFVPQGTITVDVLGYNGFFAQYDSIKLLPTKLQLAGSLLLQVPGIEMPLAGLELENLQLNLENPSLGFDGIRAVGEVGGSFAIITLQGKGEVDTFNNYYRFEGEVEIPVFEARGYLELRESARFKIPMLEEFHMQVAGDKGIPLVPPVTVGYLNGFEGGVYGLASTLDYDPTDPSKPILPPLRIAGGARFQLLELLEFWVELTAGAAYYKQSMHDMYINLKGVNFQIIEELTMEIGTFEEHVSGQRSRVGFQYNGRLRANLLKGIISDIFIAEGNLNVSASMDHPAYWLAKQETYTDVLTMLNDINARFNASGNIDGILQVPQFTLFGKRYGPFKIAEAGAWFDARIPLSSRIYTTCFRVGGNISWGPVGIEVEYDFMQPATPPDFSFELFSGQGGEGAQGAICVQTFGDESSGGTLVIGEGMRLVADSFGGLTAQGTAGAGAGVSTEGLILLDAPSVGTSLSTDAAISVYGDRGSFIHTLTVPNDGKSHWVQAARLVAGAADTNLDLTLYGPDGKAIALRPIPSNAQSTAEQGEHGYNALRSEDGFGLMIRLDTTGGGATSEYKLTSNSEFRSWLMEADPQPEITESTLTPGTSGTVSFKAENLTVGAQYFYKVMLEQKDVYNGDAQSALVLHEDYFTAGSAVKTTTLGLADYSLDDTLESGTYIPTVLLYEVTTPDNPSTTEVDEEVRELISVGEIYTPLEVTNTLAASISPGALSDLVVTAAGNETVSLHFTEATVASGFGEPEDIGGIDELVADWHPVSYQVDFYDETGQLAMSAVDEGALQTETPLSYVINEAEGADGSFDVLLAGIPGGHEYTVEVTPVFAAQYEIAGELQQAMTLGAFAESGETSGTLSTSAEGFGKSSMDLQQKGIPVIRHLSVPTANPPQLSIDVFAGSRDTLNGTAAYYLSTGAYLDITADQTSDIAVRKYSAAPDAPALKSATATTTLRLSQTDFADTADEVISSGLFAITAKNAAGDTTMELVNIVIDTTAPFLLIDNLTSSRRNALNGNFTITGSTEPWARVLSSTGQSATGDADGRFKLQGSISAGAGQEDVFITAADLAGNATTESLIIVRTTRPNNYPESGGGGGSGWGWGWNSYGDGDADESIDEDRSTAESSTNGAGTGGGASPAESTTATETGGLTEQSEDVDAARGFPWWLLAIAAVLVVGVTLGAVLYRRRRQ